MAYRVTNTNNIFSPTVRGVVETIEEAKALIGKIVLIEEDADHPNHYDAFTFSGDLYTIEPV